MRLLKKEFYLLLMGSTMVACSNNDNELFSSTHSSNINFIMTTEGMQTRSSITDNAEGIPVTSFIAGDQVNIFAVNSSEKNPTTTAAYYEAKERENAPLLWESETPLVSAEGSYKFYGVYPGDASLKTAQFTYTVNASQANIQNYVTSDLLTATTATEISDLNNTVNVNLAFQHRLALVQVTIEGSGVTEAPETVRLTNMKNTVDIDLTNETPTEQVKTNQVSSSDIIMYNSSQFQSATEAGQTGGSIVYRAFVPEQTIESNDKVLELVVNRTLYTFSYSTAFTLSAGKMRKIRVTLGESNQPKFELEGEFTIGDWTAEEEDLEQEAILEGSYPTIPATLSNIQFMKFSFNSASELYQRCPENKTGWYISYGGKMKDTEKALFDVSSDDNKFVFKYDIEGGTQLPVSGWTGIGYNINHVIFDVASPYYQLTMKGKSLCTPTTESETSINNVIQVALIHIYENEDKSKEWRSFKMINEKCRLDGNKVWFSTKRNISSAANTENPQETAITNINVQFDLSKWFRMEQGNITTPVEEEYIGNKIEQFMVLIHLSAGNYTAGIELSDIKLEPFTPETTE